MELIDVSNLQGKINFRDVEVAGIKGVYLKATEGVTFTDPLYKSNAVSARVAGLRVGAYHFARPDNNSAKAEADHFCEVIGQPKRRDLKPALDFEKDSKLSPALQVNWVKEFNARCRTNIGMTPCFYSYPYFISHMAPDKPLGNGLWIASYGPNDGKRHEIAVPKPWKKYIAHQYTSNGKVMGVSGHVDRSYAPHLIGILAYPVKGLL